ncbi:hypothetical protein M0804_006913 [Polistes exclamans]|nr:hypothetical protein M0804_006913 [Polistes exclamans]
MGQEEGAGVGARVGFDQYLAPTPYHHPSWRYTIPPPEPHHPTTMNNQDHIAACRLNTSWYHTIKLPTTTTNTIATSTTTTTTTTSNPSTTLLSLPLQHLRKAIPLTVNAAFDILDILVRLSSLPPPTRPSCLPHSPLLLYKNNRFDASTKYIKEQRCTFLESPKNGGLPLAKPKEGGGVGTSSHEPRAKQASKQANRQPASQPASKPANISPFDEIKSDPSL